ncbi:hypothetical protein [Fimbriiglobus ruber]|uniref:HTTM-like domain-containing protein n=1 Tax=Fimbriiglobus ruber TaxID=1908690 RepID=A0A225DZF9_9BACT|nr:hypothetical protein [Fimbriiglobus ruber]OWK43908.1 hypothetical protein FRUB_03507 [Fimbriiglobus ruber]
MTDNRSAPARGPWRVWRDFWFTPGDPTTLGFLRIVTGCLVLYVHLAYSFDLRAFFGPDGWYGLKYINRERTETPNILGPLDWEVPAKIPYLPEGAQPQLHRPGMGTEIELSTYVPEYPHRRRAVMAYMRSLLDKYPTRPELDHALRYLDRLQRSLNGVTVNDGLGFVLTLSDDANVRRNELGKVRSVDLWDKTRDKVMPPAIVTDLTTDERAAVADEIESFYLSLPPPPPKDNPLAPDYQKYVINHLSEMDFAQRGAFLRFLRNLTEVDPTERASQLDYMEYWHTERRVAYRTGAPIFSLWYYVTDPVGMYVAHGVTLVIIFLFTIGFCTRVTAVLTWLAAISYIHRTQQVLFGMDTMMNILLFYLMFANCGAALSVDRLVCRYRAARASLARTGTIDAATALYLEVPPRTVIAGLIQRMIQVHCCFIYAAAGMSKLKGGAWWNTNAYWDTLVNPEFTLVHFRWYEYLLRETVSHRPVYALLAAFGVAFTLIAELGIPFLVWSRARPYILLFGFMFHAGVAIFMGLWIFSLLMMTLLISYLPGAAIRDRLFGYRETGAKSGRFLVRLAAGATAQLRAAALIRALDFDNQVERIEQTPGGSADEVRVVADGRELTGREAVDALLSRLAWARPLRWLLLVPGASGAIVRVLTGSVSVAPAATLQKTGAGK